MPLSTRLLRPSATGFNPKRISGLAMWLDAADSGTLFQDAAATVPATATNDPVGAWLDKSGNGRHVTQETGAARPTRTTLVGRGAVNFDGTDDTLAYLQGLTSDNLTTFCVYRYDTLNGGIVYDATYSGDNTNAQYVSQTGFGNSIGLQVTPGGTIVSRLDFTRSFVGNDAGRSSEGGAYSAGRLAIHAVALCTTTKGSRREQLTPCR